MPEQRDSTGLVATLTTEQWQRVASRLTGRPFLRSEGLAASLAMPATCAPWLVEQSAELVRRFDRFYRAVVDAQGVIAEEPARRIGEPYESVADAEGERPALPLSRLDCVLDERGVLRVIELNPVGVSTLHLRALGYLARALVRPPFADDAEMGVLARRIDAFRADKVASIRSYIDATLARAVAQPTVALLLLPGVHRGTKYMWAHELRQAGMNVVVAHPDEVRFQREGSFVGTTRVDALWVDWFLYLGYQQARYEQTRFASKVGDYSAGGRVAAALVTRAGFESALRDRTFTLLSPIRAYRALSKALLAFIHRPELVLSAEDRAWLLDHVAETHDHHARLSGRITPESARQQREALVLKPCRFGGSHGVVIGAESDDSEWARQLDDVWSNPEWVLQPFVRPPRDETGAQLSYGVYNYNGSLGGVLVRSANETIVSARTANLIPLLRPLLQ